MTGEVISLRERAARLHAGKPTQSPAMDAACAAVGDAFNPSWRLFQDRRQADEMARFMIDRHFYGDPVRLAHLWSEWRCALRRGRRHEVRGYRLNNNVKFAHLIYSYNPIPLPGLGAYIWPLGTMNPASYHKTPHHIPHPGDYDLNDQTMFINEMRRIMEHTK